MLAALLLIVQHVGNQFIEEKNKNNFFDISIILSKFGQVR